MLKQIILNKLNNQHNKPNPTFKYVNNYTGELSNYPLLENLYVILYHPFPIKHIIPYITKWVKHNPYK